MAEKKDSGEKKGGALQFLREVRAELNKVSWPTKKELASYTGVVGLAVVIVCALIWVCDTAFAKLFRVILG
ncbi:MAG: preprotein translocase subunit SecE [Selenomonadaceae bacterium]|nr:preprotein translocase subunit SecE [Selenomonadaceae bacterium]